MPPPTRTFDPVLYDELAEPRTAEQLGKDLTAFMTDVLAARLKHKIPDVLVTAMGFTDAPAPNNMLMMIAPFGSSALSVRLARAALEQTRADRDRRETAQARASTSTVAREVLVIGEKTLATMPEKVRLAFKELSERAVAELLPATMATILDRARWAFQGEFAEFDPTAEHGLSEEGARRVLADLGAVEKDGVWRLSVDDVDTAPHNPPTLSPVDRARFMGILHGLVAEADQTTLSAPHVVKAMAREILRGLGIGVGVAWNEQRQLSAEKTAREVLRWLDRENDIRLNQGDPARLSDAERALCPREDSLVMAEVLVKTSPAPKEDA